MSLLSENVIPDAHGRVFGTNAKGEHDLNSVKEAILKVDGVTEVLILSERVPAKLEVHTDSLVNVHDVENAAISVGFHVVAEHVFPLG